MIIFPWLSFRLIKWSWLILKTGFIEEEWGILYWSFSIVEESNASMKFLIIIIELSLFLTQQLTFCLYFFLLKIQILFFLLKHKTLLMIYFIFSSTPAFLSRQRNSMSIPATFQSNLLFLIKPHILILLCAYDNPPLKWLYIGCACIRSWTWLLRLRFARHWSFTL